MRTLLFPLLFSGLIISSCTNEIAEVPPLPSEWVVIGNDLGFRNEFIDMANVVRLSDSSLTVYSVAYPDVALKFPVRDSIVIGSAEKQWRLSAVSPDTLILHDTVEHNRYHLLRLKDYQPKENTWKVITGSRFSVNSFFQQKTLIFEGDDTTGTNCYVAHLMQTWRGENRKIRLKDGFWRLDQRFNQPILLYTLGQGDHYLTLIDSVDSTYGCQGQLIINSRPNPLLHQRDTLRPIKDTLDMAALGRIIANLDFAGTKIRPLIDPATDSRRRVSWNGSELEKALSVNDFEVRDLRLTLMDDQYSLTTLGGELASGNFMLHPRYPYLILDDKCANEFCLPIALSAKNELEITLPVRIRLPSQQIRPSDFGDAPERVAYSENAVILSIPFFLEADDK